MRGPTSGECALNVAPISRLVTDDGNGFHAPSINDFYPDALFGDGTFYEPTVLRNVTNDMLIAREETFGPVAPLFRFETDEEALQRANDTEFGLASYFYTRDVARLFKIAEGLEYGIVGANTGLISTEVAPFGGIKESGTGREGSKYGIEDYLEIKYLALGGIGR